jgi:hypothetical protein
MKATNGKLIHGTSNGASVRMCPCQGFSDYENMCVQYTKVWEILLDYKIVTVHQSIGKF